MIIPVILAGGSGTRLWPLSREQYPKQLLSLVDDRTMLQNTVLRLTRFEGVGGYSKQKRPVLMTLLDPRQVIPLKRFLAENDPKAFMSVSDASEVVGKGFKSWKSL